MNDQRFYSLKELVDAANDACVAAMKAWSDGELDGEGVDWVAIECYSARQWFDDAGRRGFSVLISDADPDNGAVRHFIESEMKKRGYDGIIAELDW